MFFSVIISTWKRAIELDLIFQSLNKQAINNKIKLQVIVADSHSSKDVDSVVIKWKSMTSCLFIEHIHTENVLASKRNFGLNFAKAENIIFLDDDCIPADDFLENCLNKVQYLKEKKVFCGEIRFLPEQITQSNYYSYRDSRHPYDVISNKCLNEWTFVAMNFMISKSNILKYDLRFNESFVGYGAEDHDYGFQLIDKGFEIIQSNQRIWHYEYGGDIGKYSRKIFHTARDGMATMKLIHGNNFVRNNVKIEKIESIFEKNSIFSNALYYIFFNVYILQFLIFLLKRTDRVKFFRFYILYRYIIVSSYINGIRERSRKLSNFDLRNNWYN